MHTCKSCEFFQYLPGEEDGMGPQGGMGECHRNAPRPTIGDSSQSVTWPRISDSDWCGEYDHRQEVW
jgi:hypothetical protein